MSKSSLHGDQTMFTSKETTRIRGLEDKISSNASSLLEKQIAQAELDDLISSKMPAPHNRKHNIYNPDEASAGHNSNILHDDEAFEKFDMGATGFHRPGSKNANQAMSNRNSIKQNHKIRGTTKEKAENFDNEPIVLPKH